ncbi:hypothetical protein [Streptomyces millisiae]|uniref:Aminoglycoside phosphotransferase domain-containing protein n=1 Tax=Streptomyces millisiae TaxID=3075542 RepID=A0ABU2LPZ9_9ACTN|nr:hypothetical protein [Streptomyces sp. DSM 44918]MDT0319287.1 hypothetical protein [Streptomyces sp. DSM 44918]
MSQQSPLLLNGLSIDEVLDHAAEQVFEAAVALWPGQQVRLLESVPSVTGYVRLVEVGDRRLYAKASVLDTSLVSVLRGVHGDLRRVREAQRAHGARDDRLPLREAAQLRWLTDLGRPRVCRLVGEHRAVLFTEPVHGPSLAEVLARQPAQTAGLLAAVMEELEPLRRQHPARLGGIGIGERGISGTFVRKFGGAGRTAYLRAIGERLCSPARHRTIGRLLAPAVRDLAGHSWRYRALSVLVYGDLKPEHVLWPDTSGQPVLLDPALRRSSELEDLARLVGRTLLLAGTQLAPHAARRVVDGVDALVAQRMRPMGRPDVDRWLRDLITLWMMDTLNIVSTYLTAPPGLPLPAQATAAIDHAVPLAALVQRVAGELAGGSPSPGTWDRALERVREMARP